MQVEREMTEEERKSLSRWEDVHSKFDAAEEYNAEKLEKVMQEPGVKAIHVFQNTPINREFAALRERLPDLPRRELRKLLKKYKKSEFRAKVH